jgi:hypothetical protein
MLLEAHGARSRTGKARSIQEIDLEVEERFDQVGERIHRVTVVAIQGDDQVAGGLANPRL